MKLIIENTHCPVCGYNLEKKIFNYENNKLYFSSEITGEICPSCGSEFDFDLFPIDESYLDNRTNWIKNGMRFGSKKLQEKHPEMFKIPDHWNPIQQLKNIDINLMNPKIKEEYIKVVPDIDEVIKDWSDK